MPPPDTSPFAVQQEAPAVCGGRVHCAVMRYGDYWCTSFIGCCGCNYSSAEQQHVDALGLGAGVRLQVQAL